MVMPDKSFRLPGGEEEDEARTEISEGQTISGDFEGADFEEREMERVESKLMMRSFWWKICSSKFFDDCHLNHQY